MEVAKLSAPPNLEVRYVSCNESAKKRCLSSEQEETVFSLTHELFMTEHSTRTLSYYSKLLINQETICNYYAIVATLLIWMVEM